MSGPATPPFAVELPSPETGKGEREYQAFLRLLPELLGTHRSRYVAVHERRVIDEDADDIALVRRVHARIGYVPIHVGLVIDDAPAVLVPRYRPYPQ